MTLPALRKGFRQAFAAVLLTVITSPADAQRASPEARRHEEFSRSAMFLEDARTGAIAPGDHCATTRASYTTRVAGGLVAAVAGAGLGYSTAAALAESLEARFIAAATFETILVPIGVHLANRRCGDRHLAALASYGIGLVGASLALATWRDDVVLAASISVPLVQIATVSLIEGRTRRSYAP
jgi:hypothetical protein